MDEKGELHILDILMHLVATGADAKRLRMELANPQSDLYLRIEESHKSKSLRRYVRGFIAGFEAAEGRRNG